QNLPLNNGYIEVQWTHEVRCKALGCSGPPTVWGCPKPYHTLLEKRYTVKPQTMPNFAFPKLKKAGFMI
ncbi:hypothetical protein, partial [Limnospira indica]|uniref:hypothetical protein n=1 Tax=Limnospira indica TaxID=147322 RepID=UPI002357799F